MKKKNLKFYTNPIKSLGKNQTEKKKTCSFDSELHFTLEQFCKETGYVEDFVREAIQFSDDFMSFDCSGITIIPKSSKGNNIKILKRAEYWELS